MLKWTIFVSGLMVGTLAGWYSHSYFSQPDAMQPIEALHSQAQLQLDRLLPKASLDLRLNDTETVSPKRSLSKSLQQFQQLWEQQQYESAVDYLSQNYQAFPAETAALREAFFTRIEQLLQAKKVNLALEILSHYSYEIFDDLQAHLLYAQLLNDQQDYVSAIGHLLNSQTLRLTSQEAAQLNKQLKALIKKAQIAYADNPQQLEELYRLLLEYQPQQAQHYLALAKLRLQLDDVIEAQQLLEQIRKDPFLGKQAEQLLAHIETQQEQWARGDVQVPLQRRGQHYLVNVIINDQQQATLLLDTGASVSVLSHRVLDALNISPQEAERWTQLNTASGTVKSPIIRLQSLAVGELAVVDLAIAVLDLPNNQEVDGLLGMDYLRNFHFVINQESSQLLLSPN